MRKALASIICCLSVGAGIAQQEKQGIGKGVIYGTVVSQNGQPGRRISLYAWPLDVSRQWPNTTSDDRGAYRFENLPWGRYTIEVEDDDAGYSSEAVEDESSKPPEVEISRENPQAEFRVVLPPKAGFLSIRLTNRRTGAAIPWMSLSVARADDRQRTLFPHSVDYTSKSTEVILVPPDRNVILHVGAQGFREWDESVGDGKLIFVPSGTRLNLDVQLEPTQ